MSECHYRFNLITYIFNINGIKLQELMPGEMIPRLCANNKLQHIDTFYVPESVKSLSLFYI